jgi:hypothetical protein
MRSLAALLLLIASIVAAQTPAADLGVEGESSSSSTIVPKPTMGWVLDTNKPTIPAQFGGEAFESVGTGPSPPLAGDGAGNIDGKALIGGVPSGKPLSHYALKSSDQPTLAAGTTVILLCGRENNWLRGKTGEILPVAAPPNAFNVAKPGEWGLTLVSAVSPFAVDESGRRVYANIPPPPASFVRFGTEPEFPARASNTQICVWAFYDVSIKGSSSSPEISAAYNDGPAGTPVKLQKPVISSADPLEIVFGQFGVDLATLFVWQGAAARSLFQQPLRAAYWNGGLRKSIESGFQTPSWSSLKVTALDPRPVALGGDALDNARADSYPGFVRTDPFAHYSVTTSPGTPFLAVRYQLGSAVYQPPEYSVTFTLDGQYLGYDQPWRFGANLRSIPLPQDGRSHTLDLRNGFTRNNGTYLDPTALSFGGGGFIDAVGVPRGYKVTVNHTIPESVALVLSHSVAVGDQAGTVPYLSQGPQSSVAWTIQARAAKAFGTASVVVEAYGGEMLANDCRTQGACTAYLAAIKKAQPNITVGFVARMLNDFYQGDTTFGECLPQYEQYLRYLFTAWAEEFPGVPLHVGSDILQSAANESMTDGCAPPLKLADWRAGIESAVTDYQASHGASWLHFVDMSDWVPQRDIQPPGVHPTTVGQIKICQAVAAYFGQQVTCTIPQ